jgi:hypothetical protein
MRNCKNDLFALLLSKHKVGSIEVYDHKRQEWVPYTLDPEKWYQHFKDLSDGSVTPDHKGRYIIESGSSNAGSKVH